jgi:hypothetical protein
VSPGLIWRATRPSVVIDTVNGVQQLAATAVPVVGSVDIPSQKLNVSTALAATDIALQRQKLGSQTARSFTEHRDVLPPDFGQWLGRTSDSISITQADGTDLPKWLLEQGGRLVVKERPADVEYVYLQVRMTGAQGASEIVFMRLNVITGELSVVAADEINAGRLRMPSLEGAAPAPTEVP